jgi:integrase/recombinase XerD
MTKSEFLASETGKRYVAQMRLTGLRPVTINNYARRVSATAKFLKKAPVDLSSEDAERFIEKAALAGNSNTNSIITCVALKFYVTRILGKPWHNFPLPRVHKHRKRRARPLTREEIPAIIDRTRGRRYRLLFALIYGSGLRVGEACRLRIKDLDLRNLKIYIRDAKGGRHRETVLASSLAKALTHYIAERRPIQWLFPSNRQTYAAETLFPVVIRTKPISVRSAQREFEIACGRLDLSGFVTIHSLRHSFATHLVEYNMPLFSVQRLLGHQHLNTTLGYLSSMGRPVVEDFSPLDRMPVAHL